MKVVRCKNCGAKYQINDKDFAFYFECSVCAGDLEVLEVYPNKNNSSSFDFLNLTRAKDIILVRCEECGLKYIIKKNESILDYECAGCGGSLKYLNPEMNRQLKNYISTRKNEISQLTKHQSIAPYEKSILDESYVVKSLQDRLYTYFSLEEMSNIANELKKEKERDIKKLSKTARTSIPEYILSEFSNEFRLPLSEDYYVLKEFLKNEFFKSMNQYYPVYEEPTRLIDKIKYGILINKDENGILQENIVEEDFSINFEDLTINHYIAFIGAVMIVLSIICVLYSNLEIGLFSFLISVSICAYGLFRKEDQPKTFHTKVIRKYLLSLPEDYYIFYNVKIPNAVVGINHVIIGPTGIYTILSVKFNPEKIFNTKNDVIKLIRNQDSENKEFEYKRNLKYFRYALRNYPYSNNSEIKLKALVLSENLIDFLNENSIEVCFVEPLVGFVNDDIVVINMPLTDEDLFIEELMHTIQTDSVKLNSDMINKCAVLLSKYSTDCSFEIDE